MSTLGCDQSSLVIKAEFLHAIKHMLNPQTVVTEKPISVEMYL